MYPTRRWTNPMKPPLGVQINWGHPLAKGLAWAYLLNEGAGHTRDLVSGKLGQASVDGQALWDVWKAGKNGVMNNFPGTYPCSWDTRLKGPAYDNPAVLTVAALVRFSAQSAVGQVFVSKQAYIFVKANTTAIQAYRATDNSYPEATSSSLAVNTWYTVVAVFYGVGTAPLLYINGVLDVASSGVGTGTLVDDSATTWLVGSNIGASRNIGYAMVWHRALTPSEIVQISNEPYAFLRAPQPGARYYIPAAAAAGVTYPQLERGVRGLNRGVYEGAYR